MHIAGFKIKFIHIIIMLGAYFAYLLFGGNLKWKGAKIVSKKIAEDQYPFRATFLIGNEQQTIAYYFYKRYSENMMHQECSAVIHNIDPLKDDYKTYCKSVVADIVKKSGTKNIDVTIYDDSGAFELSEIKCGQEFKVLDLHEIDSVGKHTIASFSGTDIYQNEPTNSICYYTLLNNKNTATEFFTPQTESN